MNKILVFIYDEMADFEITFIIHILGKDAGKDIITIAYENKTIKSSSGVVYKPHKTVKEVVNEDVEGLIIPGGWNGEVREELLKLISNLHNKEKLIGAICAGPRFLAKAGILNEVKYTTSIKVWTEEHKKRFNEEDPFPRRNFISERVVRDKNVITANGIAFIDFAIEVSDWFKLFDNEKEKLEFTNMIKGI